MDGDKTEFVDKTVLNTPKPTASSTVDKKSFQKRVRPNNIDLENSLGIINVKDLPNTSKEQIYNVNMADLSYELKQQHVLANSSLQRANKVAGLPSRYLRPNLSSSSMSNISLTNESTINESDLTKSLRNKSPKNTSTPRASVTSNNSATNNLPRLSLGQSMAQLSYQIGNTDISIENFVKEFQKAMNSVDKSTHQIDSQLFSPAEEAVSMLLADEMSWRKKNEMPVANNFSKLSNEDVSYGKVSVGAFFQQKSDTLSDFKMALSPVKSRNPVPLIDSSSFAEEPQNDKEKKSNNSLSVSAIRKLLADTDDTPRKVTSFLLKQGQKLSENGSDQFSLPVSKNSSYTSNYSDNEAIRQLVADKENINTSNILQADHINNAKSPESYNRPMSTGSSRSLSSALTSLPNGKLPIESTKTELIWGCIKVDKCVTQEFLLRNRSSKKLCLQMSLTGYDFKIRKDNRQDSQPLSAAKILLYPHESRSIIVSFIPTKRGAAVDDLIFTPLDSNLQQTKKQAVRLFGYGGYGNVEVLNLTKDITGKFLLSLGKLNNLSVISHSFVVRNSGTIPCFAWISSNPKDLFAFANVSVTPNCVVLSPNEQKEITVTFVPTMEDHQVLQRHLFSNMVAEICNLVIISGTEVNRGRLRRQCRKCTETGLDIDPVSNTLKEKIKGEIMPADLYLFKEAPGNLREMLRLFSRSEVVVTVEQDPEITIIPQYPDDSGMFHTLCQENTMTCLEATTMQVSCKLEPASIILTPPTKMKDSLFLISECKKKLHFEVVSTPDGLEIFPKDGIIGPGQETLITVSCAKLPSKEKRLFRVIVYIENEVFEATVKITFIHSQKIT